MNKFFGNLGGKDDKKKDEPSNWQGGRSDMNSINKSNNIGGGSSSSSSSKSNKDGAKNIFANANTAIQKQMDALKKPKAKGGKSLGGSKPGVVYSIELVQSGPLGIEIEKRRDAAQSAIISAVVPNSQAELAGLKRGDIICRRDDSDIEYSYNEFLKVAKSGTRPLAFNIRRMESTTLRDNGGGSADAMHRKQAMIAAAEAREAKNKALIKPVPKIKEVDRLKSRDSSGVNRVNEYVESNNAQTKQAVEAIKAVEQVDSEIYQSKAMNSGQARTRTIAMAAGDINVDNAPSKLKGEAAAATGPTLNDSTIEIPQEFDHAYSVLITSSSDQALTQKSLATMRKLITNAITKGQQDGEDAMKFRRVRLSNPKIKEVITDVQGALELMMAVGFILSENEEDGETYLVYPPDMGRSEWLGKALEQMETYERGG
eukprot:scaffold7237_cov72-Cyclotella_meneghiniana.AAC.9